VTLGLDLFSVTDSDGTPGSNPQTHIRHHVLHRLCASCSPAAEARVRGYKPDGFSFNRQEGPAVKACAGGGIIKTSRSSLPAGLSTSPARFCKGKRYYAKALEITGFKGKNIATVLDMTVSEALESSSSRLFRQSTTSFERSTDKLVSATFVFETSPPRSYRGRRHSASSFHGAVEAGHRAHALHP